MQYVQSIFENTDVRDYITKNEDLVDLGAKVVAAYKPTLINHVFENLQDFIEEDDLAATYENIKAFIISENLYLCEAISDILSNTELSYGETSNYLLEVSSKMATIAHAFRPAGRGRKLIGGLVGLGALGAGAYALKSANDKREAAKVVAPSSGVLDVISDKLHSTGSTIKDQASILADRASGAAAAARTQGTELAGKVASKLGTGGMVGAAGLIGAGAGAGAHRYIANRNKK